MQFHVPQFLEVEDKLFGVLTLKQFLYIFGGIGVAYLAYTYLWVWIAIPAIIIFLPFSFALAFVKFNNQPFLNTVDYFLHYVFSPRLYIWKKILRRPEEKKGGSSSLNSGVYVPPLSENRLKDLAWSLDIKSREEEAPKAQGHTAPLLKDI